MGGVGGLNPALTNSSLVVLASSAQLVCRVLRTPFRGNPWLGWSSTAGGSGARPFAFALAFAFGFSPGVPPFWAGWGALLHWRRWLALGVVRLKVRVLLAAKLAEDLGSLLKLGLPHPSCLAFRADTVATHLVRRHGWHPQEVASVGS